MDGHSAWSQAFEELHMMWKIDFAFETFVLFCMAPKDKQILLQLDWDGAQANTFVAKLPSFSENH